MENEDLYRNLVILLKMFKDRPDQLSKYLIENSAFTDEFIHKIKNNKKLKKMDEGWLKIALKLAFVIAHNALNWEYFFKKFI